MSDSDGLVALKAVAARAGLELSAEDASKLLIGFERNQATVGKMRALIRPELEPASVFSPSRSESGKD